MKHLLLTTIAAVVLVGCGPSVLLVEHMSYLGGLQNQYPYNQKHCLSYETCFPDALQTEEG
jgi:hypothetical protein